MSYKVIKEFGSAKKGDILAEDETGLVSFNVSEDNYTRMMSLDYDTADYLCEEGYLLSVDDESKYNVDATLELIDDLLEKYESNLKETNERANKGEIQPCVKLEAETVYYNLNKVLNKIKDTLTNE